MVERKKVIRKRKSRKEKENPLQKAVRLVVESGEVDFGTRKGIKKSLLGKARMFVVASNIPKDSMQDITYYSKVSAIPVIIFEGSSKELGSVCGKPYPVSILTVYKEGVSEILSFSKKGK
ncbi:50S ribosomal protein L30e [Candidatus Micrarchaeota archaeon]|nr:50S ribosomal protein L30e [Candidatus Micrarchaeota archaeon]